MSVTVVYRYDKKSLFIDEVLMTEITCFAMGYWNLAVYTKDQKVEHIPLIEIAYVITKV